MIVNDTIVIEGIPFVVGDYRDGACCLISCKMTTEEMHTLANRLRADKENPMTETPASDSGGEG